MEHYFFQMWHSGGIVMVDNMCFVCLTQECRIQFKLLLSLHRCLGPFVS
jgi:hypothetical protein